MPTLRERVRSALSASEPAAREAAADLDAILERARPQARPWRKPLTYTAILASLGAILFVGWLASSKGVPVATPPSPTRSKGVHLYLHVAGEPEDRAVALDLTSKGARP